MNHIAQIVISIKFFFRYDLDEELLPTIPSILDEQWLSLLLC